MKRNRSTFASRLLQASFFAISHFAAAVVPNWEIESPIPAVDLFTVQLFQ
jgi:hypothetical protein